MYWPTLHPKAGDWLLVEFDQGVTEHMAEHTKAPVEEGDDEFTVEFVSSDRGDCRIEGPGSSDTFKAEVNGVETEVHIDFIGDAMGLADRVVYLR